MRIQFKRAQTQNEWVNSTRILAEGEPGVALDTGAIRVGNGVDIWGNLPTVNAEIVSVAGKTGVIELDKHDVGLDQVDNTADIAKPISAAQAAINTQLSNQIASLGETGGVTKETIGLGNVDNTSDINKPISTSTQIALNLKAPVNNPVFTGNVQGITKSMIGLAQVDNTSDFNKPISNDVQTALNTKASATDPRLNDARLPIVGSVNNNSVSLTAAISLDKTADTGTRIAMTPTERGIITSITGTLGNIHNGIITAGSGALQGLTNPPTTNGAIVAIGTDTMKSATSIDTSIAAGVGAMQYGTRLHENIGMGSGALQNIQSASLADGATGTNNIALGKGSGRFEVNTIDTVAIGRGASSGRIGGIGEVAIGVQAAKGYVTKGLTGDWENHSPVTPGTPNVALGAYALRRDTNSTGGNIAVGYNSLTNASNGSNNVGIGPLAFSNLASTSGPANGLVTTINANGTYNWSGTTLTLNINKHGVQVGDYVVFDLTGGVFKYDGDFPRGRVTTIINGDSFTVTDIAPGKPIQSLTDAGTVTLKSKEHIGTGISSTKNIGIGYDVASGLIGGSNNIFMGASTGPINGNTASPSDTLAMGRSALASMVSGDSNIAFGVNAGKNLVTGASSVFIGADTTVLTSDTSNAVAIGNGASVAASGIALGTGAYVSANESIAIGSAAVNKGASAVLVGAGATVDTGFSGATVIGWHASASGNNITAIGQHSAATDNSVAIGSNAASTGSTSVSLGAETSTGVNAIALGYGVKASNNQAVIANNTQTTTLNGATVNIANDVNTAVNIGGVGSVVNIGSSSSSGSVSIHGQLVTIDDAGSTSDARDKTDIRDTHLGLDFIQKIRPVEYRWSRRGEKPGSRMHQGVIAQQIKEIIDETGIDFAGFIDQSRNGGPDKYLVRYDEFVAPLIKSVQQLASRVEYLEGIIDEYSEDWNV